MKKNSNKYSRAKKQIGGTTLGTRPGNNLLKVGYLVCEDDRGHSKRSNIDRPIRRVYPSIINQHCLQTVLTAFCLTVRKNADIG